MFLATNLSAQSMGLKLATISDGKYYTEADSLVKRYNNILNQLDAKYIETKEQIGDMTSVAKKELASIGLSEPLINIMEGISRLIDQNTQKKEYADNIVCYIILRSKGFNHVDTLKTLQDLLTPMSMESVMKSIGLK